MKELWVQADRGDLSVNFRLSSFITDWEGSRNRFMTCVRDSLRDLTNPRPSDFSFAFPAELGEAWCKYRIFGGSSTVVLQAESLVLTFPSVLRSDYPIIVEMMRRVLEVLLPTLGRYERHSYSVSLNYHVNVMEGHAGDYLVQHAIRVIEDETRSQPAIEYGPVVGFTLRSSDGYRVFRRTIEQSEVLEHGLFIANHFFVSVPNLTTFNEEMEWLDQTINLADRASRIAYGQSEGDDDASD